MDLPLIIKELVQSGGSVVVPGLGKFYILHRSARIDKSKNLLVPPGHTLHFDQEAIADDGNLIRRLCQKYGVDEAEAGKAASQFIDALGRELAAKGHATLSGLGNLVKDKEKIGFTPLEEEGPYAGLLPSIEIPAQEDTAPVPPVRERKEAGADLSEKKEILQQAEEKQGNHLPQQVLSAQTSTRSHAGRRSIMWLPVTLLILITGLAAVLYFTGTFKSMRSDLGFAAAGDSGAEKTGNRMVFGRPPGEQDTGQEALSRQLDEMASKENALAYREPGDETGTMQPSGAEKNTARGQLSNVETEAVAPPVTERPAEETGLVASGNYHIIAGSFHVPSNAERQKVRLEQQGFHPAVIHPDDPYYMVSLASYASLDEAAAALDRFRRQLDIQLWVKKVE